MAKTDRSIIEKLAMTDLSSDPLAKEIFNRIVYNAYHKAKSSDDEKYIGAIALKYNLPCCEEIINIIEIEGFSL